MAHRISLDEQRERYAAQIARLSWITDPRIERAFATIPREAFLAPPPWTVFPPGGWLKHPTSDPADLYDDVLVVLDSSRGVNNGQPSLHAAWLAAVDPQPGETAIHVGAGTGYYTAILAMLVLPDGHVYAYEIDATLAAMAKRHLELFEHVIVRAESAIGTDLPEADVIYVNAGLAAPDPAWLKTLQPGGRLIFPWQPFGRGGGGVAMLLTRAEGGFRARATMQVGFIECEGAEPGEVSGGQMDFEAVERTRSAWLVEERPPDETATAVYDRVWFSSDDIPSPDRD
jgi:protein-L-isoaspartate(D-aspartate) O-methyltransferase